MKKIKLLIKQRKKFLAENSIQDWNDLDTIYVAELFAEFVLNNYKRIQSTPKPEK